MRYLIAILFFALSFISFDLQAEVKQVPFQKELKALDSTRNLLLTADDTAKYRINETFSVQLKRILEDARSLQLDFSSIQNLSVLEGPKSKFRIYTWAIEIGQKTYDYFGFTQFLVKKKEGLVCVTELKNSLFDVQHKKDKVYKADQWRGAYYYEIVPEKKKKGKRFLLLGWDGHDARSTKKVIEVLSFDRKGFPSFGAPIIKFDIGERKKVKYETLHRLEFEHSAKIQMTLKYDKNLKMIVFDRLIPANDKLWGVKASYVPSFSYDGLYYRKGKWYMKKNIDARNKKLPKGKKRKPSDVQEGK